MSNPSYTTIRQNLQDAFATITAANGYTNTLDSTKFLKVYAPNAQKVQEPTMYPKLFFLMDEGMPTAGVSGRVRKMLYFTVIVVTRHDEKNHGPLPTEQLESILDDVETCIARNYSLGGIAISTQLRNFKMDGGVTYPEGNMILEICVTFDSQF